MIKNAVYYFFYTEWLTQMKRSESWIYPIAFFLIIIVFFPLTFSPDPIFLQQYMPGCLWIAALLASLLSIENIFANDIENGCLEQQLLSQYPLVCFVFIKLVVKWLATALPLILLTPFLMFLFNFTIKTLLVLLSTLLLGTPILIMLGGLGAALTSGLKHNGMMLGLLILPLTTPVLIFAVTIIQQSQNHLSIESPLLFLAGISLLAITFLPFAIATVLRVSVE